MNYQNVKRDGEFFSIMNKPERERAHIELCDKCALASNCKIRGALNRLQTIQVPVKLCKTFSPYMTFSVLQGLELPVYNTVRGHSAWAKRLSVGDKVVAFNTKTNQPIDTRTVTGVHEGDKQEMLEAHAAMNHACLGDDAQDPVAHLEKILINSMGKNFYNAAKTLSVIYLSA